MFRPSIKLTETGGEQNCSSVDPIVSNSAAKLTHLPVPKVTCMMRTFLNMFLVLIINET